MKGIEPEHAGILPKWFYTLLNFKAAEHGGGLPQGAMALQQQTQQQSG